MQSAGYGYRLKGQLLKQEFNRAQAVQQKLISYRRSDITILGRGGLETASCGCYRADKETYEHVLG